MVKSRKGHIQKLQFRALGEHLFTHGDVGDHHDLGIPHPFYQGGGIFFTVAIPHKLMPFEGQFLSDFLSSGLGNTYRFNRYNLHILKNDVMITTKSFNKNFLRFTLTSNIMINMSTNNLNIYLFWVINNSVLFFKHIWCYKIFIF